MGYYIYWEDPDDPNNGTNRGFIEFEDDSFLPNPETSRQALAWINYFTKKRRNVKMVVVVGKQLYLEAVNVVTEYRIVAGDGSRNRKD